MPIKSQKDVYKLKRFRSGWTFYECNRQVISEADIKVCILYNEVVKQSGLTRIEIASRLHISRIMVYYILKGHNSAVSYYRYLPKVFAFLKACDCHLKLDVTPVMDADGYKGKKPKK